MKCAKYNGVRSITYAVPELCPFRIL